MNYNLSYGDKKSERYNRIKNLFSTGSGLEQSQSSAETTHTPTTEFHKSPTMEIHQSPIYVFLPNDPGELCDRLKLLYQEKIGGNNNPRINQEIIAIVDKLFEYGEITEEEHKGIQQSLSNGV